MTDSVETDWTKYPRVPLTGPREKWIGIPGADYAPVECGHSITIDSDFEDDGTVPCGECYDALQESN